MKRVKILTSTLVPAAVILGTAGAVPTASAATPDLCKTECGGHLGAKEIANNDAEAHYNEVQRKITSCTKVEKGNEQWRCVGHGRKDSSELWHSWEIGLSPYGEMVRHVWG